MLHYDSAYVATKQTKKLSLRASCRGSEQALDVQEQRGPKERGGPRLATIPSVFGTLFTVAIAPVDSDIPSLVRPTLRFLLLIHSIVHSPPVLP